MGYSKSPLVFTKIFKPVFASLRSSGYISCVFVDNTCLQGNTYDECSENIRHTVEMLDRLGFTISLKKSVLVPSQTIVFLGFILCSTDMTIRLTKEKCDSIVELYNSLIDITSACNGEKIIENNWKISRGKPRSHSRAVIYQTIKNESKIRN